MRANYKYVLDKAGNTVLEPDLMKMGEGFETADRKVAETEIDKLQVSTVFLGLNHNFGEGPPILWETMVFVPVQDACYCYTRQCAGNSRASRSDAPGCDYAGAHGGKRAVAEENEG